jgi:predicted RNA-binding protein with PUA-like domain
MNYWLVKQEPEEFGWPEFVAEKGTAWTGVRNFAARNHLRAMRRGDQVLFYHSVIGKEIVGIAEVAREGYPDPTAEEEGWVCVNLRPVRPLAHPVSLEQIKADKLLKEMPLIKQSRLSVMPVSSEQFGHILRLGQTPTASRRAARR